MIYGQNSRNHIMKKTVASYCFLVGLHKMTQWHSKQNNNHLVSELSLVICWHPLALLFFAKTNQRAGHEIYSTKWNRNKVCTKPWTSTSKLKTQLASKPPWLLTPPTSDKSQRTLSKKTATRWRKPIIWRSTEKDGSLLHTSRKTKRSTIAMVHPSASC